MSQKITPPFRADHVGSFLRPETLNVAARRYRAGEITREAFVSVQDEAIRKLVAWQEDIGLCSVTDGEFRRRSWSAGFIDAVPGFGLRKGVGRFRDGSGWKDAALSPFAKAPLRRVGPIAREEFSFLQECATGAEPKVTLPSPSVMHYFLGPRAADAEVYPDMEGFFADLISIYQEEIADLGRAGCRYLQLDDTALPCNCDDGFRSGVRARGEDPDRLTHRYTQLIAEAVSGRPSGMRVMVHMCRGNFKGSWMAEGSYETIAEQVFAETPVDGWFIEYDTDRAGSFAPLRFMPDDRMVVLGLVSTKTPVLENRDDLMRRIDEAARYVPLDRLCLSPQCGFSSAAGSGQVLGEEDQKRKLALVIETAAAVWGEA